MVKTMELTDTTEHLMK